MKKLLGVLLGLAGVVCAVVFLFVGGIEQIVHGATANPVSAGSIAWGAIRVCLTGLGIWLAVILGAVVTAALD